MTFAGEGYHCNVQQEEVEASELEGLRVHCWKEEIGMGGGEMYMFQTILVLRALGYMMNGLGHANKGNKNN